MFDRLARFVAIVPFLPRLAEVTNSDELSFLRASYESAKAGYG